MARPTIRPMVAADVASATAAILRDDWGDRRAWFEFATTQPACSVFVAEADGEIVGTGVGSANGSVGWVGTVWVERERRGAGLGRALTQAAIDALEARGCRTLLLVATSEGRRLYERMGFEVQTHYRILEATGLDPAGNDPMPSVGGAFVRRFEPSDLAAMCALDMAATGEDRGHVIRRFADAASAKVLVDRPGNIRGFVVRASWGGGATIAREPDEALAILHVRRLAAGPSGRVRVGLIAENVAGLESLERAGLRPIWSAPRLIRGAPVVWRPGWIWGQFNHAMG